LFLWNNIRYLRYSIHQLKPYWWWCKLFRHPSLDSCITFSYTFWCLEFCLMENCLALVIFKKFYTFIVFCSNCDSFKPNSYNLFFKSLWICYFIWNCYIKSFYNIYCPIYLTNPSFTSLLINGHSMMTCPMILQKTQILELIWVNIAKFSKL
jgi:hypothetical protein